MVDSVVQGLVVVSADGGRLEVVAHPDKQAGEPHRADGEGVSRFRKGVDEHWKFFSFVSG